MDCMREYQYHRSESRLTLFLSLHGTFWHFGKKQSVHPSVLWRSNVMCLLIHSFDRHGLKLGCMHSQQEELILSASGCSLSKSYLKYLKKYLKSSMQTKTTNLRSKHGELEPLCTSSNLSSLRPALHNNKHTTAQCFVDISHVYSIIYNKDFVAHASS